MTDPVTTRLSPRNTTFGCTHMTSADDCGGPARWVRTVDVNGERMAAGWSGDAFCDVHRPDGDPRHARMSAAIIDWLGDAVSDYARALLADDMADLDQALAEHELHVLDSTVLVDAMKVTLVQAFDRVSALSAAIGEALEELEGCDSDHQCSDASNAAEILRKALGGGS